MKKLLLALMALPILSYGQGLETFENATNLPSGTNYGNGTFVGVNGITWTYVHCQETAEYSLNGLGRGILLRRANEPSSVSASLTGGIGSVSLKYRKGYTGNAQRRIELVVNGNVIEQLTPTFQSGADSTTHTWTVNNIDVEGTASLEIRMFGADGNQHLSIDNLSWTSYSSAIACGITAGGLSALTCNDNGTGNDADDDYITFALNPTGSNLGSNGYTVSVSAGTITPATGLYGEATSFQLQNGSATAADVVVTITDADSTSCSYQLTINSTGACSSASPIITTSVTSLNTFSHMVGTPSASQNFSVNGIALTDDITVTAPAGFEVSLDNTTFTPSVTLTPASGTVAATTINVRGNATVYGPYAGNIIISSTGADNDTVAVTGFANDYVSYTIDQINGINAQGVADSLNVLVELSGVIQCMDYRATGYSMVMIDASNKGINVYRGGNLSNYTAPVGGDSITVKGKIVQFNGLLQVEAAEITLHGSNYDQVAPIVTTVLDETTENYPVKLVNITLVPGQMDGENPLTSWPTGGNTNPLFTDGVNQFAIRAVGTALAGQPLPWGPVTIYGIGSQFDTSSPYTEGYQLLVCGDDAIEYICEGTHIPNASVNVNGKTLSGVNVPSYTWQWINCEDESPIAGATNRQFTPETPGEYAVIVDNGICTKTSECFIVDDLGFDNVLASSIAVYPNPVEAMLTIKNYSAQAASFVITDINGKVVVAQTAMDVTTTINTSEWNHGIYFVTVYGENKATHTMKVVK